VLPHVSCCTAACFSPVDMQTHFSDLLTLTLGKGNGTCKAIHVTGRGGPYVCEMSRLPHFLDSRLIDGGEVVSLTRRPATLYPQEYSWYSFLLEAESTTGP
jgi:hypothetical protein